MKLDRAKKEAFVEELAGKLADAECVYLTDFTGLDVERLTLLRSKLRASSVDYVVVKNTLARRAIAGTSAAVLEDLLQGASAFALGRADVVAAAKVLTDFSKDTSLPRIKGGLVGGRFVGVDEVQRLAALPGRDVLLSRLVGSMKSPVSGLVYVLAGVLSKFVRTLDAVREKRAAAEPPPVQAAEGPAAQTAAEEGPATEGQTAAAEGPAGEPPATAEGSSAAEPEGA